ncbi:MAG: flagellar export protein FliJ [Lautropia sp.]
MSTTGRRQRTALALAAEQIARRRDEAAVASRRSQAALGNAVTTLRTLEDYAGELARRRREAAGLLARSGAGLANATAFAARLVEAVDAQQRRVEDRSREAGQAREALVDRQRRLKAIEALIERRAQALLERQSRRERRELDEWSNARVAQAAARRPGSTSASTGTEEGTP